jgi:hypothetical protein
MTHDLLSALRNLFAAEPARDDVHFHRGPTGAPAVCDVHGCDRPALTVE